MISIDLNFWVHWRFNRYKIYYHSNEMGVLYKNKRLETQWLPSFFQDTKTTTLLSPTFEGQQLVVLGGDELLEFDTEKGTGIYHVDVKFFLRMRLKSEGGLMLRYKPKVNCGLKVPLSDGASSSTFFMSSECHFKFWFNSL